MDTVPNSPLTPIPDTEPDAIPSLWNEVYTEIDENFDHVKDAVDDLEDRVDRIIVETTIGPVTQAVKKDWEYRGLVMKSEMWVPSWTMLDSISVAVTAAVAGSNTIDAAATGDLVEGREYILGNATTWELITISSIISATRFTTVSAMTNSYGAGNTISRSNLSITNGVATAENNQVYFSGPFFSGLTDSDKNIVIRRTENDCILKVYLKDDAKTVEWEELTDPIARNSGTDDYEVLYEATTKGNTQIKVLCQYGESEEPVEIKSIFFAEPTSVHIIGSDSTFYIAVDGDDETGQGTFESPWETLQYACDYLKNYTIAPGVIVNICVKSGTYQILESVVPFHDQGLQIVIKGEETYQLYITALSSISGVIADNFVTWSAVFNVGDSDRIVVGDYIMIHTVTSPNAAVPFYGCHKVLAVDHAMGTVTLSVRHANQTAPVTGLCAITATLFKSILDFSTVSPNSDNEYNGLYFDSSPGLLRLEGLVIVGPTDSVTTSYGVNMNQMCKITFANLGIVDWSQGVRNRDGSSLIYREPNFAPVNSANGLAIAISRCKDGLFCTGLSQVASTGVGQIFSGCQIGLRCEKGANIRFWASKLIGNKQVAAHSTTVSFIYVFGAILEGNGASGGSSILSANKGGYINVESFVDKGNNHATFSSPAVNTLGNENGYIDT